MNPLYEKYKNLKEIAKITGNRIDIVIAASFWVDAEHHISKVLNKAVM